MGLFSRKSSEPKTSTQPKKQQINADDIWNTPVKRAGGDTAFVKESSSDKVHAEKITDTIEPETIRSKSRKGKGGLRKLIKLFKQGRGRFFCNRERCGS